ncbi:MAG: glycoside hydrolase family 9, partial [Verrucomicrobiaceae bacterium]
WPATMAFTCAASPLRPSEAIHVNQEGYTSSDYKRAMVGFYLGSGGELNLAAGTPFTIVDANTGTTAYSGTLTSRPDVGFTVLPAPYQKVLQADFSSLTASGEYCLKVPGLGASLPFLISPSMAMTFARAYALGLYNQRCGCAVTLPYSRHEHGACHTAAASIPVPQASFTNTWSNIVSTNSDYASNPRHTAPRLQSQATQRYPYVRTGAWDVSGGHHDAGDYSKYTTNSAQLIESLTFAADSLPGAGDLDNLGIPESGDGKSDLLQEAKYEADFLAKMQDTDGGFYFLVYPRDRKYEDNVLPDAGDPQVVFPKTTSATAAAVGALAGLGSSPRFKAQYPAAAASYVAKAQAG